MVCRALHKRKLGLKCPFFLAKAPKVAAMAKAKLTKSRSKTKVAEEAEEDPAPVEEEPVVSLCPWRGRHFSRPDRLGCFSRTVADCRSRCFTG